MSRLLKKQLRFIVIVSAILVCIPSTELLAADPAGGWAGAYLKLGVDARAMGMGSAYTAISQEVSSVYWNPAGLAYIQRQEVMATYTVLPSSGDYSQIAYALPLNIFSFPADALAGSNAEVNIGTIGLSIVRVAAAYDIEARRIDSLNPDYLFSDIEGNYGLSFGMRIAQTWAVGLGVKGLYHRIDQTQANGFGTDLGVQWRGFPGLTIAMALRDVYSHLIWPSGHKDVFPINLKLGAAYAIEIITQHNVLLGLEGEYNWTETPARLYAGLEYGFYKTWFLRAGYQDGHWTMGAGVRIPSIGWGRAALRLDYAANQDQITGWDHWITLKLEL